MDLSTALRTLHAAVGGAPVAPHVAARLAEFAQGDARKLSALGSALSASHLRGTSMLPDPLPLAPELRSSSTDGLTTVERRLLLFAALDFDLSLPELIDAAGVEPDVLLFGTLTNLLRAQSGRARFVNEVLRAQILLEATPRESMPAHGALARAHRRQGQAAAAAVHLAAEDPRRLPELVAALTARAETLLGWARLQEAHHLAWSVAASGGKFAPRAWSVAGRSALWAGAVGDAREALKHVEDASSWGQQAQDLLHALDIIEQGPSGAYYTAEETLFVFRTLAAAAPNTTEQRLMDSLGAVFTTVYSDAGHADALLAKALLAVPSLHDPAWTPLAAACLAVAQMTTSVFARDYDTAGSLLAESAPGFPLALVGGGVVVEYAQVSIGHGPGLDEQLVQAYRSITPETRTRFSDELASVMFSEKSTALATAASKFRFGDPAASDDAVRGRVSKPAPAPVQALSPRQREVLTFVLRGWSNREIAAALSVSPRTVEVHVTQIMRKYGVRTRASLLALHTST